MQTRTATELQALYQETSFSGTTAPEWEGLKPLEEDVYVPQGAYFGETLITLGDTYDGSGHDCLFIQELIRLYKAGRLSWFGD